MQRKGATLPPDCVARISLEIFKNVLKIFSIFLETYKNFPEFPISRNIGEQEKTNIF